MTFTRLFAAILFVVSTFSSRPSRGDELAHMVFFDLAENTPETQTLLIAACNKHLSRHEGTTYFSVGAIADELDRDVNDRDFRVALHLVFKDKASHDKYQKHPRHLKFIAENKHLWSRVRVFDSYIKVAAVDRLLALKTSLSLPQESLQSALNKLQDAVNDESRVKLVIKLDGEALKRDGITTNQQIRNIEMADHSVAEILSTIVGQANPMRGTRLNHRNQRLVWVIDGGNVLVTTRGRAEEESWALPEVFRLQ